MMITPWYSVVSHSVGTHRQSSRRHAGPRDREAAMGLLGGTSQERLNVLVSWHVR